ncbi:MAG: DegV family protein [Bacillota bacterium]|nr:DegV family protein [Bacillota bacterium]
MSVVIITDSTSYLSPAIIDQYQIKLIPLNIHINGESFKEGQKYTNETYYNLLKNNPIFPTTSQPSTGEFLEVFEQLLPGDQALIILISSGISGTVQSAQIARSMVTTPDVSITIVDSVYAAMGLGFQVIRACELLEDGKNIAEIVDELNRIRTRMQLFFVVNDLEYLSRGGRISKIGSVVGNILKLKPVLSLEDGEIGLFEKVRTFPKAVGLIRDQLIKEKSHIEKICVIHVNAPELAEALKKELEAIFTIPIIISEPGPVIGSHVGPGTIGLCYY